MKTLFVILLIMGNTQLPQDKCPADKGYPWYSVDDDQNAPWYCWALECPGHKSKTSGLGCKTNVLGEFSKALKIKATNP